ncbi:hypothetical protein JVT61DRAFT_4924 [Boletus reticuloceps]|uniref:DASH complex subunit DUO1 n=1 Tax=Boletus reticuloceps TaxID=495285 RepID=A0A8I2YZJ5_9AGAM|nr:hypothetical protein JVT61DRAFT_4924 [Boletus reticuloceps]
MSRRSFLCAVYDNELNVLVVEVEEKVNVWFNSLPSKAGRMVVRLQLRKMAAEEDLTHPMDQIGFLASPLVPLTAFSIELGRLSCHDLHNNAILRNSWSPSTPSSSIPLGSEEGWHPLSQSLPSPDTFDASSHIFTQALVLVVQIYFSQNCRYRTNLTVVMALASAFSHRPLHHCTFLLTRALSWRAKSMKRQEIPLQSDLFILRKLDASFAILNDALRATKGATEQVAEKLSQTDALLDKYANMLAKSETVTRLIFHERWGGANADADADEEALERAQLEREREEVARREAEERARREAEEAAQREAEERAKQEAAAALAAKAPAKGRGAGIEIISIYIYHSSHKFFRKQGFRFVEGCAAERLEDRCTRHASGTNLSQVHWAALSCVRYTANVAQSLRVGALDNSLWLLALNGIPKGPHRSTPKSSKRVAFALTFSSSARQYPLSPSLHPNSFHSLQLGESGHSPRTYLYLQTMPETHPCTKCDNIFMKAYKLKKHMATHDDPDRYVPVHLRYDHRFTKNLDVHFKIHTGEKDLECPHMIDSKQRCGYRTHDCSPVEAPPESTRVYTTFQSQSTQEG